MKTIAIIAIFGVCLIAGNFFRQSLFTRVIILRQMRYAADEMLTLIRFKTATVAEITDTLINDERLKDLIFLPAVKENLADENFANSWKSAVSSFSPPGLTKGDKQLIINIGGTLGTSDIDGQIATLSLYSAELQSAYETAEELCKKKSKLYTSLGILAGSFLAVILI
ncbi:MAG: stage III sporulation protein AB [Ruminococcus sp.]|jgi:stage III sporulation protein AB|nr:stage III sporulation protein AB [Ruminococcus sp.]